MTTGTFTRNLALAACAAVALVSTAAVGSEVNKTHGSSQGLMTADPTWSAGIQLGNDFGSGVAAQKLGVGGGALNGALGLSGGSVALTGDYILLTNKNFNRRRLSPGASYNSVRGDLMPYYGAGVTVGDGLTLRAPLGVQYTMLKDPFNFFGQAAVTLGRFGDDKDKGAKVGIAFAIGARCLL